MSKAIAQGMTRIFFEPTNEPDLTWFSGVPKPRSLASFLEMWRVAVHAIRKAAPESSVVGPSLACTEWEKHCDPTNSTTAFSQFLAFAAANDVLPDVLAWHEWAPRGDSVPAHVAAVREYAALHSLPKPNICINEIVLGSFQACQVGHPEPAATDEYFEPGALVAWWSNVSVI